MLRMIRMFALTGLAVLSVLFQNPVALAQEAPKAALTLRGGVISSTLGGAKDKSILWGGGAYAYPFHNHEGLAQRLGFGFELARAVLTSEEIDDPDFGTMRLQNRVWPVTLGVRLDAVRLAYLRISLHGAYAPARQTEALQVRYDDPYSLRDSWIDIRQFGYQCSDCENSWENQFGFGISIAPSFSSKDYRGDPTGRYLSFPIRYLWYTRGVLDSTLTFGFEFGF